MDGANLGRFRPCGGSADDVALAVRSAMDDLPPANHAPTPDPPHTASLPFTASDDLLAWYSVLANTLNPPHVTARSNTPSPSNPSASPPPPVQPQPVPRARDGECAASAAVFPGARRRCPSPEGSEHWGGDRVRERVGTSHQQSLLARRRAEKAACLAWAATLRVALTNRHQESAIWTSPLVTVVVTHFNRAAMLRQAVHSVYEQDYPKFKLQLVVVDDGSTDPEVPALLDAMEKDYHFGARGWKLLREPNRYLGGARNRGAREAAGKYILFMDDDNVAKPYEVSAYVEAMENSGADAMTSFVDFVFGDGALNNDEHTAWGSQAPQAEQGKQQTPSFVFLGASADVGIFKNCFGDANSFYRTDTFHALGGYSEDKHLGYEDWELYSRIVMEGYTMQVLPEALYHYRFTVGSMQKTTSYSASRQRALRAYLQKLDHDVSDELVSKSDLYEFV